MVRVAKVRNGVVPANKIKRIFWVKLTTEHITKLYPWMFRVLTKFWTPLLSPGAHDKIRFWISEFYACHWQWGSTWKICITSTVSKMPPKAAHMHAYTNLFSIREFRKMWILDASNMKSQMVMLVTVSLSQQSCKTSYHNLEPEPDFERHLHMDKDRTLTNNRTVV
jgi:hypothetical protein